MSGHEIIAPRIKANYFTLVSLQKKNSDSWNKKLVVYVDKTEENPMCCICIEQLMSIGVD
jgi:hypothetical protein